MKLILQVIGKLFACVYTPDLSNTFGKIRDQIYTGYRMRRFKYFGKSTLSFSLTLVGEKYISIGDKCRIAKQCIITAWDNYGNEQFSPEILIGDGTAIGENCHITAIDSIQIGKNVLLGKSVTITDNSHGETNFNSIRTPPALRDLYSKGKVKIGDNVWIGDKATILSNITIGEGAIVGANSVVTKDVLAYSVVVGNPARQIKKY